MAKVQDTYNPVTGEYVKRISDWIDLTGDKVWTLSPYQPAGETNHKRFDGSNTIPSGIAPEYANILVTKYDSKSLITKYMADAYTPDSTYILGAGHLRIMAYNNDTGFSSAYAPTSDEVKAYFYGYKLANSDGTSPYYKSEVPYTPATWAEWTAGTGVLKDVSGITITATSGTWSTANLATTFKSSTKYGYLVNVVSNTMPDNSIYIDPYNNPQSFAMYFNGTGNKKFIDTTKSTIVNNRTYIACKNDLTTGVSCKLKDFRIFELPTGSQIEADFTNLSADELSAKYTFNGLCVKHWKKVTDGTGLTSTLPTASYAGYTPYRIIHQLATPEISYLTPKATIPLYDTNTIVDTNTPSDCKADVTVGYKLKSGATAVGGDITAPTPDYMSVVNSVSEDGLGKGIVRSPNMVTNGNFANGTTGWSSVGASLTIVNGKMNLKETLVSEEHYAQTSIPKPISGHKYYFSGFSSNGSSIVAYNRRVDGSYETSASSFSGGKASAIITTSSLNSNPIMILRVYCKNGIYIGTGIEYSFDDIQLIDLTASFGAGNEPTKEQCDILFATWQDKASTQTTLPTLRKIGTVADTYNPETGVLVQRIGKKVFDGTENWVQGTIVDNTIRFTTNDFNPEEALGAFRSSLLSLNSHFKIDNTSYDYGVVGQSGSTSDKGIYLRVSLDTAGNLLQFKAYLAQQYANGTPVTVYYQLATPVVTTLTKTALPTYKPTTVIESDSTVKGNVNADYKLKENATPVSGDFIASPECVNDIKDLGNSIDVVSSAGRRNLVVDSNNFLVWTNNAGSTYTSEEINTLNEVGTQKAYKIKTKSGTGNTGIHRRISGLKLSEIYSYSVRIKNIGTKPIEVFVNGLNNQATGNNTSGVRIDVGFDGVVKFENTKRRDVYDWFQVMARTYTIGDEIEFIIYNEKLELGENSSQYTPALEDITYNTKTNGVYKTNILLSNPLRSVGTVKDRLFKDSDGKWKVERNIGEKVFNGTENWWSYDASTSIPSYVTGIDGSKVGFQTSICSHFTNVNEAWGNSKTNIYGDHQTVNYKYFRTNFTSLSMFVSWLVSQYNNNTPLTIQYQLATPTYETLSQELQTKLDNIPTFPEHNYVYTVTNDNLQPTLHVDYKKLSWLRSRLLVNSLKIYSRNLTDAEMIQNYKVEKERFGM